MRRIYVAGPYTEGDTLTNVKNAIHAGETLFSHGFYPYVPHLNHLWEIYHTHTHEEWLSMDREWLELCDAVVRLPGESKGADIECEWAREKGIPVIGSVDECIAASYR